MYGRMWQVFPNQVTVQFPFDPPEVTYPGGKTFSRQDSLMFYRRRGQGMENPSGRIGLPAGGIFDAFFQYRTIFMSYIPNVKRRCVWRKINMLKDIALNLRVEINAPADSVWDALINPEKIKRYLFGTQAISTWKKGSTLEFRGVWDGKEYSDRGKILEFDKEKIFAYNYWSSFSPLADLPENYSVITFRLNGDSHKTELRLEQRGFAGQKELDHSTENWQKVLKDLKEIVEEM